MPMVWSPEQVNAGRIKTVTKAFDSKHLPWCESKENTCSCFGKKRESMLQTFAKAVADNDEAANKMYMKVIYDQI